MKISPVSFNKFDNRSNKIAFKGYTELYERNILCYGDDKLDISNVYHEKNTTVKPGRGKTISDGTDFSCQVYYADPGETINDEILDNHSYIVEYTSLPRMITRENIKHMSHDECIHAKKSLEITVAMLKKELDDLTIQKKEANIKLAEAIKNPESKDDEIASASYHSIDIFDEYQKKLDQYNYEKSKLEYANHRLGITDPVARANRIFETQLLPIKVYEL